MKKLDKEVLNIVYRALSEAALKASNAQKEISKGRIDGAQVALAEIEGLTDDAAEIVNDLYAIKKSGTRAILSLYIPTLNDSIEDIYNFLPDEDEDTED